MNKTEIITITDFKKLKRKNKTEEQSVQIAICEYLKKQYPHVIFMCDLASGMNLGKNIGGMNSRLRSSRGLPDLFIAFPKSEGLIPERGYVRYKHTGLFIELKKDGVRLKNGGLPKTKHIKEQCIILMKLRNLGFAAEFACGFEESKILIDKYLK